MKLRIALFCVFTAFILAFIGCNNKKAASPAAPQETAAPALTATITMTGTATAPATSTATATVTVTATATVTNTPNILIYSNITDDNAYKIYYAEVKVNSTPEPAATVSVINTTQSFTYMLPYNATIKRYELMEAGGAVYTPGEYYKYVIAIGSSIYETSAVQAPGNTTFDYTDSDFGTLTVNVSYSGDWDYYTLELAISPYTRCFAKYEPSVTINPPNVFIPYSELCSGSQDLYFVTRNYMNNAFGAGTNPGSTFAIYEMKVKNINKP